MFLLAGIEDVFLHVAQSLIKQCEKSFAESDNFTIKDDGEDDGGTVIVSATATVPTPEKGCC